jgi:hypothetical protein
VDGTNYREAKGAHRILIVNHLENGNFVNQEVNVEENIKAGLRKIG